LGYIFVKVVVLSAFITLYQASLRQTASELLSCEQRAEVNFIKEDSEWKISELGIRIVWRSGSGMIAMAKT
jgi:hypothetical protein